MSVPRAFLATMSPLPPRTRPPSREAHGRSADGVCGAMAARQHGLVSRDQALAAGLTRHAIQDRLAAHRWERVHTGVYRIVGSPATWEQQLMAACLLAGPTAAVSHRAAAAVWALDGVDSSLVEIVCPRRIRSTGFIAHRAAVPRRHATHIGSIPVTDPSRTLLDLGGVVSTRLMEDALDDALRRGLTTLTRLRRRLQAEGRRGRAGTGILRQLVDARDPSSALPESILESRVARLLTRAGLPRPVPQHEIRANGRLVARIDFAWPEHLVALEADGYRHHSGRAAWQRDRARRNLLTGLGWRVLHISWDDVERRPEAVLSAVRSALEAFSGR